MKRLILLTVLLLTLPLSSLASSQPDAAGYQPAKLYPGIYKAASLYRLDHNNAAWYASDVPKTWANLPCAEARTALATTGTWEGHLTDQGQCNGYAEAPTWATGNYLNYSLSAAGNGAPGSK